MTTDLDDDLRELFRRHEGDVLGRDLTAPPGIVRRVRRRQVVNVLVVGLVVAVLVVGSMAGIGALLRASDRRPAEPPVPPETPLTPPAEAPIAVGSGSADGWAWLLSASTDGACVALTDAQGSEISCAGGGSDGDGAGGVRNDVIWAAVRSPQTPAPSVVLVFGRVPPRSATVEAWTSVWNDEVGGALFDAPDGVDLNARFYVRWVLGYPYPFVPEVTVYASDDQGQGVGAERNWQGVTPERPSWATTPTLTVLDVIESRETRQPSEGGGPWEVVPLEIAIFRDEATGRVCFGEVGTNAVCGPAEDPAPAWEVAVVSGCEESGGCEWPPFIGFNESGATDPEQGATAWGWGLLRDPVVAVRAERFVLNDNYGSDRDGWLDAQLYALPAEYGAPFRVYVYSCGDCLTGDIFGVDADGNDVAKT
jgi:hypothetical protein